MSDGTWKCVKPYGKKGQLLDITKLGAKKCWNLENLWLNFVLIKTSNHINILKIFLHKIWVLVQKDVRILMIKNGKKVKVRQRLKRNQLIKNLHLVNINTAFVKKPCRKHYV